jgi:GNAT superfamily N-acetyltransferase
VTPFVRRPYIGVHDLRQMQMSVAAAFPEAGLHIGDLAWLARDQSRFELQLRISLWEDTSGRLAGWTFQRANGEFNLFVDAAHTDVGLIDQLVDTVEETAAKAIAAGDPAIELHTYGIDIERSATDRAIAAALESHGYRATQPVGGVLERDLHDLPDTRPPANYVGNDLRDDALVPGRVEAQRLVFVPSELTLTRYRRVRSTWPYDAALDRVVLDDSGAVAAFCTAWPDEINRCGLLEPVGTVPAHRRRGLARTVCLEALHALRASGMTSARVGFVTAPAAALYRSIGFRDVRTDIPYERDPGISTTAALGAPKGAAPSTA